MRRLWKNWVLLILGLWIMFLPWSGFPAKNTLFLISGFVVVLMSFAMARQNEIKTNEQTATGEKVIQA